MKRLLIAGVAMIGGAMFGVSRVHAGDCGCSTPVATAPAPNSAVAQNQPANGYRTYSYQPSTGYSPYSIPPIVGNRATSQRASGFHGAGWKSTGGSY